MTKEIANYILKVTNYSDYEVTDVYEDSFRAIRKNEWILSELNAECMCKPKDITKFSGIAQAELIHICIHVLKRYKG